MDLMFVLMNDSVEEVRSYNNNTDKGFTLSYTTLPENEFHITSQSQLNYEKLLSVLNEITIPAIAVFGLIGNLLNLVILSVRCSKKEVDVLERGALTVLIALALSDMLFCLTTLPYANTRAQKRAVFNHKDFSYYFKMYGLFFQNVFIKTSTWLTCVVGLARYVGICHPIRARIFIGIWGIRIAIISSYFTWFLLMMPLLWQYEVHHVTVPNTTTIIHIFDQGYFFMNAKFRGTFLYIWFIFGYFIPVVVLAFCNTCLIRALRQSVRLRNRSASSHATSQRQRDVSNRITLTLITLIVMYMVLVSPSEVLAFYSEVIESDSFVSFELAVTLANVLQAINVSFHFVLYCCVNATFRRTICSFVYMLRCKEANDKTAEQRTTHSVISMRNGTATGSTSPCPHKIKMCPNSNSTTGTMI